ncbi:MAG: hypothetical protein RIT02_522 [Planctomycetota bacterium]
MVGIQVWTCFSALVVGRVGPGRNARATPLCSPGIPARRKTQIKLHCEISGNRFGGGHSRSSVFQGHGAWEEVGLGHLPGLKPRLRFLRQACKQSRLPVLGFRVRDDATVRSCWWHFSALSDSKSGAIPQMWDPGHSGDGAGKAARRMDRRAGKICSQVSGAGGSWRGRATQQMTGRSVLLPKVNKASLCARGLKFEGD